MLVFKEAARWVEAELTLLETPELAGRSVRENRFEAIFVDPSIANFSRQGFTRVVRLSPFNSQTPIVLISTPYAEKYVKFDDPGVVTVMAKPSSADDLLPYLEDIKRRLRADRRKNRRLPYRTGVNCLQGGRRLKATSVNISTTGILLEMSWAPKFGEELELHFQLGEDERSLNARARVVRIEGPGRAALGFHSLPAFDRERVRRLVEAHLPALR